MRRRYTRRDRKFNGNPIEARLVELDEIGWHVVVNGRLKAREGDYMCFGTLGDIWPMPKKAFEALYEEVA